MKFVKASIVVIVLAVAGLIFFGTVGVIGGICLGAVASIFIFRAAEGVASSSSSGFSG